MFKRLTIRTDICVEPENNIVYNNPNDPEGMYNILDLAECLYNGGEVESSILLEISNRLAAYEDIGLSPEEVQELKVSVKICEDCWNHAQAKAEGRLLVLPCKVGTRVWVIGQDCDLCHDMYTEEPCLFGDCEYRKVIESVFLPGMTDEFGKTVFLTREAAEKALEGASHNKRGNRSIPAP